MLLSGTAASVRRLACMRQHSLFRWCDTDQDRNAQIICHGIPDKRPLENGDIVNVDVSVFYKGYHGDLNETYLVGDCDEESKRLVQTTAQVQAPSFPAAERLCLQHVASASARVMHRSRLDTLPGVLSASSIIENGLGQASCISHGLHVQEALLLAQQALLGLQCTKLSPWSLQYRCLDHEAQVTAGRCTHCMQAEACMAACLADFRVCHVQALDKAMSICKPGTRFREIGDAVSSVVASAGFGVVRSYCGHGTGTQFHCSPNIPHYANSKVHIIGRSKSAESGCTWGAGAPAACQARSRASGRAVLPAV